MTLLKFGNYTPPAPTEYSVDVADADAPSTGRGENGVMNRDRVRGGDNPIYTLSVGWQMLTDDDMRAILSSVKEVSVSTTFYFGTEINVSMYAGNRKLTLHSLTVGMPTWDLSFTMTQF